MCQVRYEQALASIKPGCLSVGTEKALDCPLVTAALWWIPAGLPALRVDSSVFIYAVLLLFCLFFKCILILKCLTEN